MTKNMIMLENIFNKKKELKKQVLVLAIFIYITNTNNNDLTLNYILYICYLVCSWKSTNNIEVFIDYSIKVNIITSIYSSKLGF